MSQSTQALREAEDKKLAEARAQHDKATKLLDQLPSGTPAPSNLHTFGYCADYGLEFERVPGGGALVARLLELYPPLDVVDVSGGTRTQKPVAYLRGQELGDSQLPLFPVIYKSGHESSAHWWTSLPCGTVQVRVKGAQAFEGVPDADKDRYEPVSHGYSTGSAQFLTRKLARTEGKLSPLAQWDENWNGYARERLTPQQARFLFAMKARLEAGMPCFTRAELPEPQYVEGGTAVAFGPGEDLVEGVENLRAQQAARKDHPLDNVGNFWRHFDEATAVAMLDFVRDAAGALEDAKAQEAVAEEQVRQAIRDLLRTYGWFVHEVDTQLAKRVQQHLTRKTGLAMTVMNLSMKQGKGRAWVRFWSKSRGFEFNIEGDPQGPRLQPQHIDVLYV